MTASTTQGRAPASLRRHNLRTLLRHLHMHGATSRAELCEITGLTRSAIGDLVGELSTRELVLEAGPSQLHTGRGRPPLIVAPHDERAYVLAAAVEVDTIRVGRVALGGTLLEEAQTQHEHIPGDPTSSLEQLTRMLHKWAGSAQVPPLALGVAVPGLVRAEDGLIARAPNLEWRDVSLGDELRRRTGFSQPIVIGNEARLATLAEHRRGAGRDCDDLVYVSAEVGVGGGIITGNRVLTGNAGYGGEVGHMLTHPGGRRCHCGARGCWETEIGADALLRNAGVTAPADRHAALDELFALADQHHSQSVEALRSLCDPVATGLANLVNIFNPERVILGGLLQPMMRHVGAELNTALGECRGLPELPIELRPAQLGEHGRLLGAAEAAVSSFLTQFD